MFVQVDVLEQKTKIVHTCNRRLVLNYWLQGAVLNKTITKIVSFVSEIINNILQYNGNPDLGQNTSLTILVLFVVWLTTVIRWCALMCTYEEDILIQAGFTVKELYFCRGDP